MAYSDEVLADSPAGYWKLDETTGTSAPDSSGNSRNGTHNNSPLLNQTTTVRGSSAAINYRNAAPSEYTSMGNFAHWQVTSGTLEAWIKMSSPGASYRLIIGKENAYSMFLVDSKLGFYDFAVGLRDSTVNLADNAWHHVVLTFQSGVANGSKLYIDGAVVLTSQMTVVDQTKILYIANSRTGATDAQAINGLIDEVAFYPSVLSPTRVLAHYNTGKGLFYGEAALSGTGSLTTIGVRTVSGAPVLSGTGSLTAAGVVFTTVAGSAALTGTGDLTATGVKTVYGAAALSGTGTLDSTGVTTTFAEASLDGAGDLSSTAHLIISGAATLTGSGSATATADAAFVVSGAAALTGTSTLTAAGVLSKVASATLSGTGALTGSWEYTSFARAALSGEGTAEAIAFVTFDPERVAAERREFIMYKQMMKEVLSRYVN